MKSCIIISFYSFTEKILDNWNAQLKWIFFFYFSLFPKNSSESYFEAFALCTQHSACAFRNFFMFRKYPCYFFVLPSSLIHSGYFFCVFIHSCGSGGPFVQFGWAASFTVLCQQVVVGVAVNGSGKLQLLLDLDFFLHIKLTYW